MTSDSEWIKSGDRSHPDLKLVDELRRQVTYPGHDRDLDILEQCHFSGKRSRFEGGLYKIRESQKVWVGDRSHPRLVKLDAIRKTLSYDGWVQDWEQAEKIHLTYDWNLKFDRCIEGMRRKQAMHRGDRTHENLQLLDSLRKHLTYAGWEEDFEYAMESHKRGSTTEYHINRITDRERLSKGNRSHPRLVALDSLKLTYPGWEKDVKDAEHQHAGFQVNQGGVGRHFRALLSNLERKQQQWATGTSNMDSVHPSQREIIETCWTYPGWQGDVERAKEMYAVKRFDRLLDLCRIRQMIHDNDFSRHPGLIKLGEMQLSYPGWQADVEEAKNQLAQRGFVIFGEQRFYQTLEGMRRKQNVFDGFSPPAHGKSEQSQSKFGECRICWDVPCTHAFVPCGHICACKTCIAQMSRRGSHRGNSLKCPMCKQVATMTMEVFLP